MADDIELDWGWLGPTIGLAGFCFVICCIICCMCYISKGDEDARKRRFDFFRHNRAVSATYRHVLDQDQEAYQDNSDLEEGRRVKFDDATIPYGAL